jgi:hypothetical protein
MICELVYSIAPRRTCDIEVKAGQQAEGATGQARASRKVTAGTLTGSGVNATLRLGGVSERRSRRRSLTLEMEMRGMDFINTSVRVADVFTLQWQDLAEGGHRELDQAAYVCATGLRDLGNPPLSSR